MARSTIAIISAHSRNPKERGLGLKKREPIFRAELIDPFSRSSRNPDEPHPNDLKGALALQLAARLRGNPHSSRGPCAAITCRPVKEGVTNRERRINFSDRKFYKHCSLRSFCASFCASSIGSPFFQKKYSRFTFDPRFTFGKSEV